MQANGIANNTAAFANATAGGSTSSSNSAVLNSDFNTFLKMLTTQMTNQDPLNPIDSSEYAAQLAAFSSVEQQVVTNDLLEGVMALLTTSGLNDLSGWIGREVRSEAPVQFDGGSVEVEVARASGVDESVLEVYSQTGTLVRSIPLDPHTQNVTWHGADDNGAVLPDGLYEFRVNNFVGGVSAGYTSAHTFQEVHEVRSENGQIQLILNGGNALSADSVSGVRS